MTIGTAANVNGMTRDRVGIVAEGAEFLKSSPGRLHAEFRLGGTVFTL